MSRGFSQAERDAIDAEELMVCYAEDKPGCSVVFKTESGYIVWIITVHGHEVGRYHPHHGLWVQSGKPVVRIPHPSDAPEVISRSLSVARSGGRHE